MANDKSQRDLSNNESDFRVKSCGLCQDEEIRLNYYSNQSGEEEEEKFHSVVFSIKPAM